jgi:hypothetical protein
MQQSFIANQVGRICRMRHRLMEETTKTQSPESNNTEKLVDLIQTLVFTFVIVLVIFRIVGCCEIYNIIESRR